VGSLQNRGALVTGAARGIGAAVAAKLASEGARVVMTDVDAAALAETAAGIGANWIAGDLLDARFADHLVNEAERMSGGVDIIVNNAGFIWPQAIHRMTDEQFDTLIDIHAGAPFRILRAAAPLFRDAARRDQQEGRVVHRKIVNISSIIALSGSPLSVNYAAGKAAVMGLTRTLAKEWGRYNVNVNCIAFGMVDTRLTDPEVAQSPVLDIGGKSVNIGTMGANADAVRQMIPMGRSGTVEDAADGVYLFCSPDSDYVTGQMLVVGGGLT
jgi:3-oxoacyl-[acyl-carrier protein] reductase